MLEQGDGDADWTWSSGGRIIPSLGIYTFIVSTQPVPVCSTEHKPQQPPSCRNSEPPSWTLDALPTSVTFAIIPSARSTNNSSPNGTPLLSPLHHVQQKADHKCEYRQALRYIIRNTTLPQRVRAQAQIQLTQMHCYTRFTQIKNRCIAGGRGRGILSDFRLGRVCVFGSEPYVQANFIVVPISNECACRKPAWCEEGKLVVKSNTRGWCGQSVYYLSTL